MGKKQFCFFQTAETGNRTPDSGVKGSGANHYPRAPAPAYGSNNLQQHILKQCATQLSPSLANLFTFSMRIGKVPSQWKASNVVPTHKKRNKSNIENCRPTSLLSCVSNIMER